MGINSNNQAVVNSNETTSLYHDLVTDSITSLNYLPGASETVSVAINNSDPGHVAGTSGDYAFVWTANGGMADLGTLGGTNSWATAINNNLIVGYSETGATYSQGGVTKKVVHACAWYNNVIYDLGIHDDFYDFDFTEPMPFSEAVDVNDNNRIGGSTYSINSHYRGFYVDSTVP